MPIPSKPDMPDILLRTVYRVLDLSTTAGMMAWPWTAVSSASPVECTACGVAPPEA